MNESHPGHGIGRLALSRRTRPHNSGKAAPRIAGRKKIIVEAVAMASMVANSAGSGGLVASGGTAAAHIAAPASLAGAFAVSALLSDEAQAQGVQGPKGDRGDKGVTGDKGEQGEMGFSGPKGQPATTAGPKGDPGESTQGAQGAQGARGAPGPKGEQGSPAGSLSRQEAREIATSLLEEESDSAKYRLGQALILIIDGAESPDGGQTSDVAPGDEHSTAEIVSDAYFNTDSPQQQTAALLYGVYRNATDVGANRALTLRTRQLISDLRRDFGPLQGETREGTAIAIALGGIRLPEGEDRTLGLRMGHFEGENALGAGAALHLSQGVSAEFGLSYGFRYSQTGYSASLRFNW